MQHVTKDAVAFISVFAALLLDNVLSFEETAGRVSDLVTKSGRLDGDLIVALQNFDRLKQEFEALGSTLARYAESMNVPPADGKERGHREHDAISAITVSDLKDRLLFRLWEHLPEARSAKLSESELAEMDVDVIF